jgi:hypothetical protein
MSDVELSPREHAKAQRLIAEAEPESDSERCHIILQRAFKATLERRAVERGATFAAYSRALLNLALRCEDAATDPTRRTRLVIREQGQPDVEVWFAI